jgi:hypothetical protein
MEGSDRAQWIEVRPGVVSAQECQIAEHYPFLELIGVVGMGTSRLYAKPVAGSAGHKRSDRHYRLDVQNGEKPWPKLMAR